MFDTSRSIMVSKKIKRTGSNPVLTTASVFCGKRKHQAKSSLSRLKVWANTGKQMTAWKDRQILNTKN